MKFELELKKYVLNLRVEKRFSENLKFETNLYNQNFNVQLPKKYANTLNSEPCIF